MRSPLGLVGAAALLLLGLGGTAAAQYAFAEMWDGDAPVLLRGRLEKVEWTAPNAQLHVIDQATGQAWIAEGGPPASAPDGLREKLRPGVAVVIRGYQAKDKRCTPACRANLRDVTLADGTRVIRGQNAGVCQQYTEGAAAMGRPAPACWAPASGA